MLPPDVQSIASLSSSAINTEAAEAFPFWSADIRLSPRSANVAGLRSEESEEEDESLGRRPPAGPENVSLQSIMMMIDWIHQETLGNFIAMMPGMIGVNIDYEKFHNLKTEIATIKKEHEERRKRRILQ